MADTKITDLAELAAAPAAADELVLVDDSDTTMAASGTNKRISFANLLKAPTLGGVAGDTLTVNAGIWTLGSNYVATRAGGVQPSGITNLINHAVTLSGHADGTTNARGWGTETFVQGSNDLAAAVGIRANAITETTAGTIGVLYGNESNAVIGGAGAVTGASGLAAGVLLTSTGNVTSANVVTAAPNLFGAGNITTARSYYAVAPVFGSTGAITNNFGFVTGNLGHATLVANAIGFEQADFTLGAAALCIGFRSQMTSGTGKWAFYSSGTAASAFAGSTRFGSVVAPTETVHVTGTLATSGIAAIGTTTSATTTLNLPLGATGVSPLRIAHGVAPSSPVNGDIWTTNAGVFSRINGATRAGVDVLATSGAQVADKGNVTSEETFVTVTVPANALGANGMLRVWTQWNYTNSANDKTERVRFSGAAGSIFYSHVATSTASLGGVCLIQNRNATNSQVGGPATLAAGQGAGVSAAVTAAVDTTASTTIVITGQKETGTETLTLERYIVEILPSA